VYGANGDAVLEAEAAIYARDLQSIVNPAPSDSESECHSTHPVATTIYLVERSVNYDGKEPVLAYTSEAEANAYVSLCEDYATQFPRALRYGSPEEEIKRREDAATEWWANRPDPEMQPIDTFYVTPTTLHTP
jgi:hypothetical protein